MQTIDEARRKRCWRNVETQCVASDCMAWAANTPDYEYEDVDLPDALVAECNGIVASLAEGCPDEEREAAAARMTGVVRVWLDGVLAERNRGLLPPHLWGIRFHRGSVEKEVESIVNLFFDTEEGPVEGTTADLMRVAPGGQPSGECGALSRGSF